MKLTDYLFEATDKNSCGDTFVYSLRLIPSCPIYAAHFPGVPITPGVCQIQLVKELLEDCTGRKLKIHGVKNAKFISVLRPGGQDIKVTLSRIREDENRITAQAVIADDETTYAKLSIQTTVA